MASWAEQKIALSKMVEGGSSKLSLLQHLRAVWKATRKKPVQLENLLEPPRELLYLWRWLNIHAHPLSFQELSAWCSLTGIKLSNCEIEALVKLDRIRDNG